MGFCSGVRTAVEMLEQAVSQGSREARPVYTIGPLIHNEQFLTYASAKGVRVIESPEDAPPGIAVVRAHGIPSADRQRFIDAGFTLLDGTCVRVKRSQRLVQQYTRQGTSVLIAGDEQHGEVVSLQGFAIPPGRVHVVKSTADIVSLRLDASVLLIAQTTFSRESYREIQEYVQDHKEELGIHTLEIVDSICPATKKRQEALKSLAEKTDGVVVIGGKHSANTRRLYELVREMGKPAWLVSQAQEITETMKSLNSVGLTAGASTPQWIIEDIAAELSRS